MLRSYTTARRFYGMELSQWLATITGSATAQEIAAAADLPKRTVQHQISTGRMSLENKVLIGVAYGHHPLRTLIEWDIINPEWERIPDIDAALRLATEDQLADEVLRRMKIGVSSDAFTTPVDDLASRRSNVDVRHVDTELYVADMSPDEDALRGDEP